MPIYEYICHDCDKQFEILVRSDDRNIGCPQCHGQKLLRKFSTFGMKSSGKFVASGSSECSSCSTHSCSSCKCH